MNQKLYYTIESIIAELAWLICHNKNISPEIVKFYTWLNEAHINSEFDYYIAYYEELTPDFLADELYQEYHNRLDLFLDDLIKEANEANIKQ